VEQTQHGVESVFGFILLMWPAIVAAATGRIFACISAPSKPFNRDRSRLSENKYLDQVPTWFGTTSFHGDLIANWL